METTGMTKSKHGPLRVGVRRAAGPRHPRRPRVHYEARGPLLRVREGGGGGAAGPMHRRRRPQTGMTLGRAGRVDAGGESPTARRAARENSLLVLRTHSRL